MRSRKRKIETEVDEVLFDRLKALSARDGRPIEEIVEAALRDYADRRERRPGLLGFLDRRPSGVTGEQLRETMEADFYDQ